MSRPEPEQAEQSSSASENTGVTRPRASTNPDIEIDPEHDVSLTHCLPCREHPNDFRR